MKHLVDLARCGRAVLLAGLLLAGGCHSSSSSSSSDSAAHVREEAREAEEREEEEEPRPDRPDLALAQDADLTRDPATGTVPRERLLAAKAVADKLRAQVAQRAAASSLSTANWVERGPSNVGGRVRAILPDPTDATGNIVWAGSVGGGLWKSTNATSATPTWSKVDDTFANLAITTLAADPTNANVLYFGTGEGYYNADAVQGLGIWKSTNHGVTWAQLPATNSTAFYYVNRLAVDKNGWVYAATLSGLRRSKDQGATWATVLSTPTALSDVDVNPSTGAVYASGSVFATGGGIFRSATGDAGTFTNLNTLTGSGLPASSTHYRVELAIAPSDPSRLYAMYCSTSYTLLGIYRSSDGGNTWATLTKPADADTGIGTADMTRGQAWYDLGLGISPTDPNTVFVGGVDIFKTSNGGDATVTWQQVTHWYGGFGYQNIHADQHAIVFAPGSGTRAYFGNDGGVATTANATATIPTLKAINTSFNVTQFYSVAVNPQDKGNFLAGAQDNGTQRFTAATGAVTTDVNGGDGAFCAIDEDTPSIQFATYVYCNISRSTNTGASFPTTIEANSNKGSFINPLAYDSKANVLYYNYGTAALRRALNATGTPTLATIALPTGAGTPTHVMVSPNVDNRVYVGTSAGKVFRLDNANATATITQIYANASTGVSISGVAVERGTTDQHLLLTLSNYGSTVVNVWQSTNGGTSWTNAEGNLPDMPVRWVVLDPTNGQRALLATELGVWTTDNLSASPVVWQPSNTNLANVRVDMLRVRSSDLTVVAATHGRGLFTSTVLAAPLPVELTAFSAAPGAGSVRLAWTTASELNSARFEVERSTDGHSFEQLGQVAAAGNSSHTRNYTLLDAAPPVNTPLYYRLRQVDQDGAAAYSPVRTVAPGALPTQLVVFPNPARRVATVAGLAPGTVAHVYDVAGRQVATVTLGGTGLAGLELAAGSYVVRAGGQSYRLQMLE